MTIRVPRAAVRALRERTGQSLAKCRQALIDNNLDEEKAAIQLSADSGADSENVFLRNQFLIAMPGLEDDNFSNTVSLLCEHNYSGAVGLIINRPTDLTLGAMLDQMGVKHDRGAPCEQFVFWGGPVQPERGFVVHSGPGGWDSSMPIGRGLYITTSRDVLTAIGEGRGPEHFLVTLGYSGWAAGQLEDEILQNAWLSTPVDAAVLFQTPVDARWQSATKLIGLDIAQLGSGAGHA